MMGCSNPHPHGQAWSLSYIPGEAGKELKAQKQYSDSNNGAILLLEYAQAEIQSKSPRIVIQSEHFAALTPYWALWPFEVIVCPTKRHIPHIAALSEQEKQDFADVLRRLACRYDNREPKSYSQTKKVTEAICQSFNVRSRTRWVSTNSQPCMTRNTRLPYNFMLHLRLLYYAVPVSASSSLGQYSISQASGDQA